MSAIKVVFTFDENYVTPALIASLSLLDSGMRQKEGVGYDLFFLTEKRVSFLCIERFERFLKGYENCVSVNFVVANGDNEQMYESRHLTRAAYLRLEIPELLECDKVIYSDVDVLYLSGLNSLWNLDLGDLYLAGTLDVSLNRKKKFDEVEKKFPYWRRYFDGRRGSYFQSGILLMNLEKLREDAVLETWRDLAKEEFNYHDMDIINIVCYPKILKIGSKYNVIPSYLLKGTYMDGVKEGFLGEDELEEMCSNPVMIHYPGIRKPWKCPSVLGGYEYWCFLRKFPTLLREVQEEYAWSFWDRLRNSFVKPIFD